MTGWMCADIPNGSSGGGDSVSLRAAVHFAFIERLGTGLTRLLRIPCPCGEAHPRWGAMPARLLNQKN